MAEKTEKKQSKTKATKPKEPKEPKKPYRGKGRREMSDIRHPQGSMANIAKPPAEDKEQLPAPLPKKKSGAKELYDEKFVEIAFELAKKGLTRSTIAARLGVARSTLLHWKKKYPEFEAAIDQGLSIALGEAENSLHRQSVGYYYYEDEIDSSGNVERLLKYQKPSTTATIFELCNRARDDWQHVNRIEHTGGDGGAVTVNFGIPRPERQPITISVDEESPSALLPGESEEESEEE